MAVLQTVGDYDLIEKLAEGGMGTVYRGRHRTSGQVVAIKIVPPHMANNQVLLRRFENEFRAASKLDHPNVVRALDYGLLGNRPYLVMEFVEGESLGQRLERDGKLPEAEAIRVISLAAQGLEAAHEQGLIHRDVKPDNIMVTPDGEVKLADLGLVKEADSDMNLTRTGRGLGTPHFMAPEQFRNAKNADIRCDIYSLGATLYMLVTGDLPFKSCGPLDAWMKKMNNELKAARDLNPALSEGVNKAIQRAMYSDPKMRPANCREFIADLNGAGAAAKPAAVPANNQEGSSQDLWYLVYKDDEGETHTVKGTAANIRKSLQEGLLGDASNIRASRTKGGTFAALTSYPEFRDVTTGAAKTHTHLSGTPTPTHLSKVPTDVGLTADADRKPVPSARPAQPSADLPEWVKLVAVAVITCLVTVTVVLYLKR